MGGENLRRGLGILVFGVPGAAFRNQELHQSPHHVVIGMANQRGRLPHLIDQADHHQRLDMMGEGGGRDFQFVLQPADRQPGVAGANQRAVDFQPGRIAQSFQVCGGVIEFHDVQVAKV
jgi:hypothetical protein